MTGYLLDTDRLVDYLKGRPDAIALLESLVPAGLAISIVTYGEIYRGIHFGRNREQDLARFHAFLQIARLLPITRRVAQRWAILKHTVPV
jgi:predicted nucleic acid-binding protein